MQEPAIQKALTTLEFLSQDEEARRLYEDRERALHDYVSDLEGAREEGSQARAIQIARNLLNQNLNVKDVSDVTGLTIEEVEAIQRQRETN